MRVYKVTVRPDELNLHQTIVKAGLKIDINANCETYVVAEDQAHVRCALGALCIVNIEEIAPAILMLTPDKLQSITPAPRVVEGFKFYLGKKAGEYYSGPHDNLYQALSYCGEPGDKIYRCTESGSAVALYVWDDDKEWVATAQIVVAKNYNARL